MTSPGCLCDICLQQISYKQHMTRAINRCGQMRWSPCLRFQHQFFFLHSHNPCIGHCLLCQANRVHSILHVPTAMAYERYREVESPIFSNPPFPVLLPHLIFFTWLRPWYTLLFRHYTTRMPSRCIIESRVMHAVSLHYFIAKWTIIKRVCICESKSHSLQCDKNQWHVCISRLGIILLLQEYDNNILIEFGTQDMGMKN